MKRTVVLLPDLRNRLPQPGGPIPGAGWLALDTPEGVSVPSLDDARHCAHRGTAVDNDPCEPRVEAFDPPDGTAIIGRGTGSLTIRIKVTPSVGPDVVPELTVQSLPPVDPPFMTTVEGTVSGSCRQDVTFVWDVPSSVPDGAYELSVAGFADGRVTITLGATFARSSDVDPCALTLTPSFARVGIGVQTPPASFPKPPLIAVDDQGCVVEAWSVDVAGHVLVPENDETVDVLWTCRGGLLAAIDLSAPVRDAIFWQGVVAVLTDTEVRLFDLAGCPLTPAPLVSGLTNAVALAISDQGFLMVVQVGGPGLPNLRVFRRDGTEVAAPATVGGRGFYASHRNAAIVFDPELCTYTLDPSHAGTGCCVSDARPLTDDESLFFRLIDDLRDLRKRLAFPLSGTVILGPSAPGDPLDAGRPGTQWHRILLFGEIPDGCAVRVETRSADDLLALDPFVPEGWSRAVLATPSSVAAVDSPGDTRVAAADVIVLAGPARFLSMRLTLLGNGIATPRITSIETELPRIGIGRFLPEVFQNSTPEDDFLRRWLAIFEDTAFDGVALRMDNYAELFDPRTAPVEMLPFLAGWLEILETERQRQDTNAFRRVLARAAELAEKRGTIDGLVLAVELYMGLHVQVVESFKTRSGFVLDAGTVLDGVTGAALGCQTVLTVEKPPTWLGDEPRLGCSFLLDCEERSGTIAHHFDILVPARVVCSSEDLELLRLIIDTEKPAHTDFTIRPVGPAGFVLGVSSTVGQEIRPEFDRNQLDPRTFGLALLNGPPRPHALGQGFALGRDSRLFVEPGAPTFRLDVAVGRTTHISR